MIENRLVAGIVAGIPISLLCLSYALVRRDVVVGVLSGSGEEALDRQAATVLTLGTATLIGPLLGLVAGFVYGSMPSASVHGIVAFTLAAILSLAALALRTPLAIEKIVLNFAVALALGVLLPRITGG